MLINPGSSAESIAKAIAEQKSLDFLAKVFLDYRIA